jgi:DNA-binding NarL/FixJ family response regulator
MDKSILVVEDDPAQLRALTRQLSSYRVSTVASAEAALDVLRGLEPISAAVVDIGLPGMSGLELVEQIRQSRPRLPIVMLTACLDRDSVNRAARLGAWYLCKPVAAAELEEVLARLTRQEAQSKRIDVAPIIAKYALSPREAEVLGLALQGLRRDVIRQRLGIRETTVKKTVARLLRKCGAASLREIELNPERFAGPEAVWQPNLAESAPSATGAVAASAAQLVAASLEVSAAPPSSRS